jgi:hypothetical protein
MIALGIAVAGVCCGLAAIASAGAVRAVWIWTSATCAVAAAAYVANRPRWLGKEAGRMTPCALLLLPYHVAFRIACALMRWWRGPDVPTLVAPGVWVGGRLDRASFPAGVTHVIDLVAEYPAPGWARALPGYRNLLVLDGGQPPDPGAFLALVSELRDEGGGVLVHCDSGRGRAPTLAAALLIARGLASDVADAVALVRARRVVAAPTRADLVFLERVLPELRALQRGAGGRSRRDRA